MTVLPLPIQSAITTLFGTGKEFASKSALEAAATLAGIARQADDGDLEPEEAADLVEAQRKATFIALQTSEGMPEVDKAVAFDALKSLIVKAASAAI